MNANIKLKASQALFALKKASPEILMVTGAIGVVASVVMACKATTKVNDILEEQKEQINKVHEVFENEDIPREEYSEKDMKKDLTLLYTQTAVKLIRLYGPAAVIFIASMTGMISSNVILRKRNIALTAAYATIDKSFKEYRERVKDKFGEEVENQLRFNLFDNDISEQEKSADGDSEKPKAEKKPFEASDYARIFDEYNENWTKNPEYNMVFLKQMRNIANDHLATFGHLFLNDVYKMLGFEPTKAGQVVGWVYDKNNPKGDNYVDFGIFNLDNPRVAAFASGYETSILLDFNVDGVIIDRIDWSRI